MFSRFGRVFSRRSRVFFSKGFRRFFKPFAFGTALSTSWALRTPLLALASGDGWEVKNQPFIESTVDGVNIRFKEGRYFYGHTWSMQHQRPVQMLLSKIRDPNSSTCCFRSACDRLGALMAENALGFLKCNDTVKIPTGTGDKPAKALSHPKDSEVAIVSVLRSGDIIAKQLAKALPTAPIGQILIQRRYFSRWDLSRSPASQDLHWMKLPDDIKNRQVIVCDPAIQTGKTAEMVLNILKTAGCPEPKITIVSFIASQSALRSLRKKFPNVDFVVGDCSQDEPNELGDLEPGFGDIGDRYFGYENAGSRMGTPQTPFRKST